MAYNYGLPPGAYQPPYAPPGGRMNPPGMNMGAPPTFGAAPGMDAPPGMPSHSPGAMQGQFQPPNIPNINFNAPVIRLGLDGQRPGPSPSDRMGGGDRGGRGEGRGSNLEPLGNRGRLGLGAGGDGGHARNLDRERQQVRENMMALQPPTREEVARTIFVGGLGEGVPNDELLERILRCAGKLRRWTRAKDADDKKCKFGFAEYEDVESLEAANEILKDVEVPLFDKNGYVQKDQFKDGEVKKSKLLVVVDEQSLKYIEEWKGRRKEDDDARQFRIDGCKEDLRQTITGITNSGVYMANGANGQQDGVDVDGDKEMAQMNGEVKGDGTEVVNIPMPGEDELSDIPADMRATVAEEIKAFRDRSNRRDLERLRREEELEQAERQRNDASSRMNRLSSPPLGPASAANGIPVGPRNITQGVQGAPSGPKGFRGAQLPNDYVNGVAFVPGAGLDGKGVTVYLNREDEDAEESDNELDQRRQKKKNSEFEKHYQDQIRRWHNRERTRGAAQDRERAREEGDRKHRERERDREATQFAKWNNDEESRSTKELYYTDRSAWFRRRAVDRDRESQRDENDRQMEEREQAEERRKADEARGLADNFLDQIGSEMEAKAAEQATGPAGFGGFKISLGSAAAKTKQAQAATASKKVLADVEGLLEDEEDAAAAGMKRPELKPLQDTSTVPMSGLDLTEEEKTAARQNLAQEIPLETAALFAYPIKWDSVDSSMIDTQIRPFVERKVVEYLGVQEDLLVDAVLEGVRNKKKPEEIVGELEPALEDDAEVLVKKVWRLLVFWGESESRGIGS